MKGDFIIYEAVKIERDRKVTWKQNNIGKSNKVA